MQTTWLLAALILLALGACLFAAEPYPRSIPTPKDAKEPEYRADKVEAGDKTKLVVHEWSPPKPAEGTPVVLLVHGIGLHGKPYEAIAAGFTSKSIILVAPDLRGHGSSEGERGVLPDTKMMRDDLDAVADHIKARYPKSPIVLMGESMGGLIAADYARREQKRFAGLILFAPAFSIHAKSLQAPNAIKDLIKTAKVPIHGPDFVDPSSRDEGFIKACKEDPLGVHEVKPSYLFQLGKMGMEWPMAASDLKLPLYVAVGVEDTIIDNKAARRMWTRAKADKTDKVWKEWEEARHTLCWDPLTPKIIEHAADWVRERTKP